MPQRSSSESPENLRCISHCISERIYGPRTRCTGSPGTQASLVSHVSDKAPTIPEPLPGIPLSAAQSSRSSAQPLAPPSLCLPPLPLIPPPFMGHAPPFDPLPLPLPPLCSTRLYGKGRADKKVRCAHPYPQLMPERADILSGEEGRGVS